jgi:glutamyl-tRNA synthetase
MHIGGIRTALFAYLWAKKNNGTFILRLEDTDKEREVPGSKEHIVEALQWLGLEWDLGVNKENPWGSAIQSERLSTYKEAAMKLVAKGLAYPDPYSAEEVDAFRKQAQAEKQAFLFRNHRPEHPGVWDGNRPLRFKVPTIERKKWHDAVRGDLEAGEEALDDFILIKADGYPTYNFAHIIDDYHMGVTHIMRADEFISSTPRFLSLYEALEIPPPTFVTLPPIMRADKTKKLGKRDGAKDILEYRKDGYIPDAFVNFLAFIGWNPGTAQEVFTREELIAAFDVSGIQQHGAIVNDEKLDWFNKVYIQKMSDDHFASYIRPFFPDVITKSEHFTDSRLAAIVPILKDRISVAKEISEHPEEYDFFFVTPTVDAAMLIPKKGTKEETREHLVALRDLIDAAPEASRSEAVKQIVWEYAEAKGRGAVLWPLRVALTGKEKSPDPFTTAAVLGKQETRARIDAAIAVCV